MMCRAAYVALGVSLALSQARAETPSMLPDAERRETRSFGPFYENTVFDDGSRLIALRPFYSLRVDPDTEYSHTDWIWPLCSWRAYGDMRSGRLLIGFYQDFDVDDPESKSRIWLLPIFFSGRNRNGEPYTAFFPLGGKIHDILYQDTVRFLLFPLYADSRRGATETRHVLWPFFSVTSGPRHRRLRVFPLYGRAEEPDGTRRHFVMWPIWTSVQREHTVDDGGGFVLFPLFGFFRTEQQRSIMFLPPFFRYSKSAAETELLYPWPFLQYSAGETDRNYLWPLWGRKSAKGVESSFLLWPLGRFERRCRGDTVAVKRTFYPFYFSRRGQRLPEGEKPVEEKHSGAESAPSSDMSETVTAERYKKIWPLFSYKRRGESTVFRAPDLWPGPPLEPVDRNIAPFWTLYAMESSAGARRQEALWGLFRRRVGEAGERRTSLFPLFSRQRDATGERREISILQGLLRFGSEGERSYGSLLYFLRWGAEEEQS